MSSIFTKISLLFYFILMFFFIPYFSLMSIVFFLVTIGIIILYARTKVHLFTYLRFPLLLFSLYIITSEYGTWKGFEPAGILFSTLVLLKIFELKTKRDIYSLILIQLLHILSLSLLVEDFYYLFIIFISLIVCFGNFYLVEQISIEDRVVKNGFKKILKFSLLGSPILILLFLSFPRFNFGGFLFSTTVATTGFSEDLRPGDISEIIKDPSIVFHVNFTKPVKRLDMYWRGQILASNDHFNWSKVKLPEIRNNINIYKKYDYVVTHDTLSSGPLFTLEKTRKLTLSSPGSLRYLKGNLYYSSPIRNQKARYKGWLGEDLPAILAQGYEGTYLQTNIPGKSKVDDFVTKNKSLHSRPTEVALFLKDFFRENFKYSTKPGVYDGETPLDDFLFGRRVGFCGHFASASASLFRLFGIPSRVIVGYQGGMFNEMGDFYVISQRDAHSWVEYLAEDGIWTRFDAVSVVSPERIAYGADAYFEFEKNRSSDGDIEDFISNRSGLLSEWRQFVQNIYYKTGTLFFNYDLESQKKLLNKILDVKYSKTFFQFYISYLIVILFIIGHIVYRRRIQSLLIFLCINKYKRMSWRSYTTLTETQLISAIASRSLSLVKMIKVYESLSYSRGGSPLKELSFFSLAFKIIIYDK